MSDYKGAMELLNSNAFPGRYGWKPRWVILHATAGGSSAQGIAQYFKNSESSDNPVSAHYVVDQQGIVYQCNRESEGAWANGVVTAGHDPWWSESNNPNPNNVTISIEHVKPDDANATALTSAQQAASFALIKDICQRNNIPMRAADANGGITGHFSVDRVNRSRCPGTFDWNALWAYLGGQTMGVPQGWTDDGTTLTAKNGHKVVAGFRGWILTHNWDPANVPLEEEHNVDHVEDYYASDAGARQLFNYCELAWTKARGVYVVGIGNELRGCRKERDALKSQIATLQAQIAQLENLPVVANFQQIATIGKQIADDVNLILKLAQVQ